MTELDPSQDGHRMLREGRSDEEVERLTGLTLLGVIELRAMAAAAPAGGATAAARPGDKTRPKQTPDGVPASLPGKLAGSRLEGGQPTSPV